MSSKDYLRISEVFYSLQGEGQTMGIPAVFIRLGGCNLLCESDSWRCDTIEVWSKSKKIKFADVLTEKQIKRISEGAHIVFTGGEPLLHQRQMIKFIHYLISTYKLTPVIEVETNGTILMDDDLYPFLTYINCSPKLDNSGEPYGKRVQPHVLAQLNKYRETIFKFVIEKETDVLDLMQDYQEHISFEKVVLMPAGETQEKLNITRPIVVEQALKLGMKYCDRLHIVIWNQKTGV